jgi:hypothetical protein
MAKYGADSTFIWGATLGSESFDYGNDVRTGGNDYVIWIGSYGENSGPGGVDFNPDQFDEDIHWSMGQQDSFIIKMHPSSNYLGQDGSW